MTKHCKQCSEKPEKPFKTPRGAFCDYECAMQWGRQKAKEAADRKAERNLKKKLEPWTKAKPVRRPKTKTDRLNDLQTLVNRYVRLRDAMEGCNSCDKPMEWGGQWHASHYYSRGHSSALRFNLWNIHKACSICNSHKSGNISAYTPKLIDKIGQDRFDWLQAHKSDKAEYSEEWIERAIKIARRAIKRLERRQ